MNHGGVYHEVTVIPSVAIHSDEEIAMRAQASMQQSSVPVRVGQLAILSTRHETRIIRVLSRAADICLDWKVEILGSPLWCVDARTNLPALTNLALVKDGQLFSLETDDMELSLIEEQDG
ncbi:hypothetical protein CFB82_17725 [Burkholderia sp. HI2714]|uniref:hypothetical protein n=1 Tax=Burkholderia sp. HI2714 TaxID=2015359 RepID=UPI000B920DFD|nr:hypothetical protein [Burkholderia sp. HI2714]OXJ33013.1 hypothetical protein CFB82_17725 [Burkholderia sp. HI2714]